MTRVLAIGECMIELTRQAEDRCRFGYGGDSLNTAVYLARLGIDIDYLTALGDDPLSEWLIGQWQAENVGTGHVLRIPGGTPGLYLVATDSTGERRFTYWRDTSAARALLCGLTNNDLASILRDYDLIYLTGISLAILPTADRTRMIAAASTARGRGADVVVDVNYRPALWPDRQAACDALSQILECADIVFLSEQDVALFGDHLTPDDVLAEIAQRGAGTIVLRRGARGASVVANGQRHDIAADAVAAIDTTAAGDSFNAAYLAARSAGKSPRDAAACGCDLAGDVIQYPGAIAPRESSLKLVRGCR